ncbi:MAG: hypothetical protein FJZ97_04035 [Chloroflexi bacterium]|nr:hypothetical protein [Chloroflexota bacterium]
MTRLRQRSTPVAFLGISLSLAVAAMACNAVTPTDSPASARVLGLSPTQAQESASELPGPSAAQEPAAAEPEYSGTFLDEDCACEGYESSKVFPWGNASLDCRYDWSGPNIDQNALGFSVVHYYHVDRLQPGFQQRVDELRASLPGLVEGDHLGQELRNDDGGYAYVVYGPGGGGKQGDIPLCGNGRGVYQLAGEFVIETDLFACDLPYSSEVYGEALADMQACAARAVERIR